MAARNNYHNTYSLASPPLNDHHFHDKDYDSLQHTVKMTASYQQHPSKDNCDRHRPQEEEKSRIIKMPADLVGQHVSPFLKQHIPGIYAPIGKQSQDDSHDHKDSALQVKDSNTRYCYRHRPDSKCRRAADETKMGVIQRVRKSIVGVVEWRNPFGQLTHSSLYRI